MRCGALCYLVFFMVGRFSLGVAFGQYLNPRDLYLREIDDDFEPSLYLREADEDFEPSIYTRDAWYDDEDDGFYFEARQYRPGSEPPEGPRDVPSNRKPGYKPPLGKPAVQQGIPKPQIQASVGASRPPVKPAGMQQTQNKLNNAPKAVKRP